MNGSNRGQANEARARAGTNFLSWLKRFEPKLYSHVISQIGDPPNQGIFAFANNLGQLGQNGYVPPTSDGTDGDSFMDYLKEGFAVAKEAIPAYFAYETQKDIMELNIARAEQGMDPIDPGVVAPQVRHIVDVNPETQAAISQFKLPMQLALWGALGLGAFMLFRMLR